MLAPMRLTTRRALVFACLFALTCLQLPVTGAAALTPLKPQDGKGVSEGEPTRNDPSDGPPVVTRGGVTVLTFEGLLNQEPVNEFYNGGMGGSGSGPGPNVGISFTSNSLALIDADAGGSGNFGGEPSPSTGLFFLSGTAIMNVPAGFDTGFSFFYSAINNPGSVSVFSGPNGTGTLLTTLPLPLTPNNGAPDPTGQFSPLVPIGVAFAGTAMSVDFGGTVNQIVFDDITLGSQTPGGDLGPCETTTQTFTQDTDLTIPPSGTVSSTITVAGATSPLVDVDMQTFIQHPFPTDLDITLTSPAGTVVTITTDNGGSATNAFNGTVWDDDGGTANPPGAVTDTTFAANVVETTLVPEEAMGAFRGEDPNGVWTLTITDDFAPDGGTLTSWSLTLTSFTMTPVETRTMAANNTPVTILDNATATSLITIAGAGTDTCDVNVTTNIVHTFPGDIDMTLTSPAGTVVTLTTDNGSSAVNAFNGTLWDDDAGTANPPGAVTDTTFAANVVETALVPEEAMGAFRGEDPNGVWTLTVTDDAGGDTGSFTWSLDVGTCQCPVDGGGGECMLVCPPDQIVDATSLEGTVVNFPAPTLTGDCGKELPPIVCTPPSGSEFPVGTTEVTCIAVTGMMVDTQTYSSGPIAVRIPEAGTSGDMIPQVMTLTDAGTVTDIDVRIRANHTFTGDLSVRLQGPDGTIVSLIENRGGSGDNFGSGATDCTGTKTVLDDEAATAISAGASPFAGSFRPEAPLTAFDGDPVAGDWTLLITDEVGGDSGTLFCWELVITRSVPTGLTCTFDVTVAIPFDLICVDRTTGNILRVVLVCVDEDSPLRGVYEYEVVATGEIFSGRFNIVTYVPNRSARLGDNVSPNIASFFTIDFGRDRCLGQLRDRVTGREFQMRDDTVVEPTCDDDR